MMKNLKSLRKNGLLKSKSYGLSRESGAMDYFWSLGSDLEVKERGYEPPKKEVHANRYYHERNCGDIFVSLMLADLVVMWTIHKRLGKDFIPDRTWDSEIGLIYIEHETGSQSIGVWRTKILNYLNYYAATREQFYLLFTMPDNDSVISAVKLFEELKCSSHYYAAIQDELVQNPFETLVTNRFTTKKLSDLLSITPSIT